MTVLRNVWLPIAVGAVLAILCCVFGFGLAWAGQEKFATVFLWPFLVLKPLIPCVPRAAPQCVGDAFASGTVYLSFGLAVVEYSIIAAFIMRRR